MSHDVLLPNSLREAFHCLSKHDAIFAACTLRCPVNSYCFGGDRVESPLTRGSITTCGANLITRNTGSRTKADCVAPAGFALASAAGARPCNRSEYAPMYNR
jgi:hypothetical protein